MTSLSAFWRCRRSHLSHAAAFCVGFDADPRERHHALQQRPEQHGRVCRAALGDQRHDRVGCAAHPRQHRPAGDRPVPVLSGRRDLARHRLARDVAETADAPPRDLDSRERLGRPELGHMDRLGFRSGAAPSWRRLIRVAAAAPAVFERQEHPGERAHTAGDRDHVIQRREIHVESYAAGSMTTMRRPSGSRPSG
jgi:hypothetical protein